MIRPLKLLARRFAGLWKREHDLEAARKGVAQPLLKLMLETRNTVVQIGKDAVYLVSTVQKRVSKEDVSRFFGADAAEKFWETIAPSSCTYLTVKPAEGVNRG